MSLIVDSAQIASAVLAVVALVVIFRQQKRNEKLALYELRTSIGKDLSTLFSLLIQLNNPALAYPDGSRTPRALDCLRSAYHPVLAQRAAVLTQELSYSFFPSLFEKDTRVYGLAKNISDILNEDWVKYAPELKYANLYNALKDIVPPFLYALDKECLSYNDL